MARTSDRDSLHAPHALHALLRPVVTAQGLDLEDVVVTPAGSLTVTTTAARRTCVEPLVTWLVIRA